MSTSTTVDNVIINVPREYSMNKYLYALILVIATSTIVMIPHAIAKKSAFDIGLSDGKRDAKASTPTSTMTPDQVDCESPDNLSGQDSVDYCKGYEQGFAQENNILLGK
jgi:hypothetical protein